MKNIKNIENSYNGHYKSISNIEIHIKKFQYLGYYFHFKQNPNWGKKVLDFGGRIGEKTRLINNVIVVEIDDQARKFMKKNKIKCTKRIDSFKDNSIDTIYASHVLEHVDNPAMYLAKFYKKLKKEGNLIIALPVEFPVFETKQIDTKGHIYSWNLRNINTLLDKLNFRVEENYIYSYLGMEFILKTFGEKIFLVCLKFFYFINRFKPIRFLLSISIFFCKLTLELLGLRVPNPEIVIYAKKK